MYADEGRCTGKIQGEGLREKEVWRYRIRKGEETRRRFNERRMYADGGRCTEKIIREGLREKDICRCRKMYGEDTRRRFNGEGCMEI